MSRGYQPSLDQSAGIPNLTAADLQPFIDAPDPNVELPDFPAIRQAKQLLNDEISELLDQGPWVPFVVELGISGETRHFYKSSQTIRVLSLALPYLNVSNAAKVEQYLTHLIDQGCPLQQPLLPDVKTGNRREYHELGPGMENFADESISYQTGIEDLYSLWAYAHYTGNWSDVLAQTANIENTYNDFASQPFNFDHTDQENDAAEHLNRQIAGVIAYIRIMNKAGQSQKADSAAQFLTELVNERVYHELANRDLVRKTTWILHRAKIPQYCGLVPETARILRRFASAKMSSNLERINSQLAVWYHAFGEKLISGENYISPPHLSQGVFIILADGMAKSSDEMIKCLDYPWCRADLYYIEKLAALLRNHNYNIVDLDDSGRVNFGDFATFSDYWGLTSGAQEDISDVDFDRNEVIDFNDLSIFTTYWLWTSDLPPGLPGRATEPYPCNGATGVSVTADLSWTAGSDANSHDVHFGEASPGDFQGNQPSATFDTGTMTEETTYYWRIDEINAQGTTTGIVWNFTTEGPTPPAAPTNLTATGGTGSVSLDWNDNSEPDLQSYSVYRDTTSGEPYTRIAAGVSGSDYVDTSVTNDVTYYYVVTAADTSGNESANSNEASATPQVTGENMLSGGEDFGDLTTDGWGFNWVHPDHANSWCFYDTPGWSTYNDGGDIVLVEDAGGPLQQITPDDNGTGAAPPSTGNIINLTFDYKGDLRVRVIETNWDGWQGLNTVPQGNTIIDESLSSANWTTFDADSAPAGGGYDHIVLYISNASDGAMVDSFVMTNLGGN